jgi:hypothetical protein
LVHADYTRRQGRQCAAFQSSARSAEIWPEQGWLRAWPNRGEKVTGNFALTETDQIRAAYQPQSRHLVITISPRLLARADEVIE